MEQILEIVLGIFLLYAGMELWEVVEKWLGIYRPPRND